MMKLAAMFLGVFSALLAATLVGVMMQWREVPTNMWVSAVLLAGAAVTSWCLYRVCEYDQAAEVSARSAQLVGARARAKARQRLLVSRLAWPGRASGSGSAQGPGHDRGPD